MHKLRIGMTGKCTYMTQIAQLSNGHARPATDVVEGEGVGDVAVVEPVPGGRQQHRPVAGVAAGLCAIGWRTGCIPGSGRQQAQRYQQAHSPNHLKLVMCSSLYDQQQHACDDL